MRLPRRAPLLHAAVAAMFFAFGVGMGLWGGASGAILIARRVDAATFGIILTVYTGAYLIAMSAGGALGHRFGVERALAVRAIVFGAACARSSTPGARLGWPAPLSRRDS